MSGKVALVTGANQGLGFAIVKGLAHRVGTGGTVYLGARDQERGDAAVRSLPVHDAKIETLLIDVTDDDAVGQAAQAVLRRHGGIDIVISNAAARMAKGDAFPDIVRGFADTNNGGQRRMTDRFVPILKDNGAFLAVASSFGSLTKLPTGLWPRFDTTTASLDDIDRTIDLLNQIDDRNGIIVASLLVFLIIEHNQIIKDREHVRRFNKFLAI